MAFYCCWTPGPVTLAQLVRAARVRRIVEESFQAGKGQVGLDQHQVRRWTSWHRFTTLALAVLAIRVADARTPDGRAQPDMIELTVNEIRRLINVLLIRPTRSIACRLRWSHWRRRHHARARQAHYTRRLNLELQPLLGQAPRSRCERAGHRGPGRPAGLGVGSCARLRP